MIHYKPESTPVGDRLNSESTKIREGQGALQKGSEEIAGPPPEDLYLLSKSLKEILLRSRSTSRTLTLTFS